MTGDHPDERDTEHGGRRRRSRVREVLDQHPDGGTPDSGCIHLGTHDTTFALVSARDDPLVGQLAVEDVCWRFAHDDWVRQRPAWWHRAERRQWRATGVALQAKRARIDEVADELADPAHRSGRRQGRQRRCGRRGAG